MRIAQVLLPDASEYERKSQRIDRSALGARHEVLTVSLEEVARSGAEVAHIYASNDLPARPFVGFPLPYVSSTSLRKSPWSLRKPVAPNYVVTPLELPEAVEDVYFAVEPRSSGRRPLGGLKAAAPGEALVIGTFQRESVQQLVEQSLARIHRVRDDVTWRLFSHLPAPEDLAGVDLWVDPAASENDYSGFVAEALVVGLPVVATRTAVNAARLEQGRTGMLVPPRDPNEMTHAILSALFKPEVASNKVAAARQTASKFRAKQRLRVLLHMYQTLIE